MYPPLEKRFCVIVFSECRDKLSESPIFGNPLKTIESENAQHSLPINFVARRKKNRPVAQ